MKRTDHTGQGRPGDWSAGPWKTASFLLFCGAWGVACALARIAAPLLCRGRRASAARKGGRS